MSMISTHYRDPDRGFRMFHRSEIVAPGGSGQWVPNPNDLVFDPAQGFMVVTEVDRSTGLSVLDPWNPPKTDEENNDMNVLIGVGPGYVSESYRMFVDQSVTPHSMTPDSRLHYYGSMVDHYKVFLGSDISQEYGQVVSTFYDPSGNFLGTSVPMETITTGDSSQDTIKAPAPGYTVENLKDGELVMVVAYAMNGRPVSSAKLLVKNTEAIRRSDSSKRYVKAVSIDTPFISAADPQTIEFPMNVTVESLPMTGLVHYSDGSTHRLPIDGGKFSLYGLNNYIATVIGQEFPMVLAYNLAQDEISYDLEPTANRRLTVAYRAKTAPTDGSYSVKLYVYPVWVDDNVGYRLEYWLYNLDRQTFYNATPYIEMGVNSAPLRPKEYGVLQTLTVALDLNRLDGVFAPYRHVQTFQVALMAAGNAERPDWSVHFRPDQRSEYGRGLRAPMEYVNTNYWRLNLTNGEPSLPLWLNTMYRNIEPLFHPDLEIEAPDPTHFKLKFLHNAYEYPVADWDKTHVVNNDLGHGELLYIEWIRRNYDTDLQLGISAVVVTVDVPT